MSLILAHRHSPSLYDYVYVDGQFYLPPPESMYVFQGIDKDFLQTTVEVLHTNCVIYTDYTNFPALLTKLDKYTTKEIDEYRTPNKYIILVDTGDVHIPIYQLPENILAVYSPNMDIIAPKYYPFPRGVLDGEAKYPQNTPKTNLLYINFGLTSHSDRPHLFQYFCTHKKPWITIDPPSISQPQYYEQVARHKFVVSPPGNGVDTYRTWEILNCGSFPIVFDYHLNRCFADVLPIACVSHYEELVDGKSQIEEMYEVLCKVPLDALQEDWWGSFIRRHFCA